MSFEEKGILRRPILPACVGVEEAAQIMGWPGYFIPVLLRTGHLKPLGRPSQNSRKWFASVELERLSRDPAWLDKAVRIVEKHVAEMNQKQRGKPEEAPLLNSTQATLN